MHTWHNTPTMTQDIYSSERKRKEKEKEGVANTMKVDNSLPPDI